MKVNPLSKVRGCAGEAKDFCVSDSQKHIKKKEQGRVFKETVAEKLKNKAKPF